MALSDGQDALNDMKLAIAEDGSDLIVNRQARPVNGVFKQATSRKIRFIPLLEASAIYPQIISAFGGMNQGDLSNHDIFYCLPSVDIQVNIDTILYEGTPRAVTKIRQPMISNVVVVKAVYVLKDLSG